MGAMKKIHTERMLGRSESANHKVPAWLKPRKPAKVKRPQPPQKS